MTKRHHQFKGFDDPVEIFRAGTHTDSEGRISHWTEADLDQMITNHTAATEAPAVIGHPETNDPAYGWVERLERKGKSLFAKFKNIAPEFASAVEKGRFRKRSISVGKTPNGWRLLHVGWLGAKAPALDLDPMNYSVPEDVSVVCDFEADWMTPSTIARAMRRLREFLIEQFGLDAADRVMPGSDVDFLDEHADDLRNRERERSSDSSADPAFASFEKPIGDSPVTQFSQADLDKARNDAKAEAKREFEQQQQSLQSQLDQERAERNKAEFSSELNKLQDEGKLTPAQAAGALEFMQAISTAPQEFEFAAADGKSQSKIEPLAWFRQFIASLPKQVDIGPRKGDGDHGGAARPSHFAAPNGSVVDSDRLSLHDRALKYAQANNVPYIDAVMAVEQQQES